MDEKKPNIDERLEAIVQSLEILTHDVHDMQGAIRAADKRERQGRAAILEGVAAYLKALTNGDGEEPEAQ